MLNVFNLQINKFLPKQVRFSVAKSCLLLNLVNNALQNCVCVINRHILGDLEVSLKTLLGAGKGSDRPSVTLVTSNPYTDTYTVQEALVTAVFDLTVIAELGNNKSNLIVVCVCHFINNGVLELLRFQFCAILHYSMSHKSVVCCKHRCGR